MTTYSPLGSLRAGYDGNGAVTGIFDTKGKRVLDPSSNAGLARPAFCSMGDSTAAANTGGGSYKYKANRGPLSWLLQFSGQSFDFQPSDNTAVSNTSTQHLLTVQLPKILAAVAAGRNYQFAYICCGANDYDQGLVASQTEANLQAVFAQLTAAGITPFYIGIRPRGYAALATAADTSVTTRKRQMVEVSAWAKLAGAAGLCEYFDTGELFADNSNAFFNAIVGVTWDGLHPSQYGAMLEANFVWKNVFSKLKQRPAMALASNAADTFDRQFNRFGCLGTAANPANPILQGASAIPDRFVNNGGTWSSTTRTLDNGQTRKDPTLTFAASTFASLSFQVLGNTGGWSVSPTGIQVGDMVEARARVRLAGGVNLIRFDLVLTESDGTTSAFWADGAQDPGDATLNMPLPDGDYWLRTPAFPIRDYSGSGAVSLSATINTKTGTTFAGTMQVMGLEIRPVSLAS